MKKILHGLYNGDIIPWERRNPNSEKQRALLQKIESEEQYFMEKMSLDDCSRFQALSNMHTVLSAADENNIFSYGFTLGLNIMLEVTEEARQIVGES